MNTDKEVLETTLLNEGAEEHSVRERLRTKQREQKQQQIQRKTKRHEQER